MPFFVGLAAVGAGVVVGRLRAEAGSAPARPRLAAAIVLGLAVVGVALLAIGWWAAGRVPDDPALASSVAYVGASLELFFAAMLAPIAARAARSSNPSWRARRR